MTKTKILLSELDDTTVNSEFRRGFIARLRWIRENDIADGPETPVPQEPVTPSQFWAGWNHCFAMTPSAADVHGVFSRRPELLLDQELWISTRACLSIAQRLVEFFDTSLAGLEDRGLGMSHDNDPIEDEAARRADIWLASLIR